MTTMAKAISVKDTAFGQDRERGFSAGRCTLDRSGFRHSSDRNNPLCAGICGRCLYQGAGKGCGKREKPALCGTRYGGRGTVSGAGTSCHSTGFV
jgi:hypothetical protein